MSSQQHLFINKRVEGVDTYYPANEPAIGAPFPSDVFPQNKTLPILFQPLTLRGVEFKNRIFVSPMCQYSSDDGHASDFHLVHIGQYALGGAGAIIMEATAVVPEGRISPEDGGLWTDSQIAPLKRIVDFAHAHGTKIGIQLAHAGRKASTYAPWVSYTPGQPRPDGQTAKATENGWPEQVNGPSPIAWSSRHVVPHELTVEEIKRIEDAFIAAVERCKQVGFDFIELHAAHGYLCHEFLSPISNKRTDAYGGSLENRARLTLDTVKRIRGAWSDKPFFVRISAYEWTDAPERAEDGTWASFGIEQSKWLVQRFIEHGVDLVDVSTSGNWHDANIILKDGYQTPFAREIKQAAGSAITVGTVGLIHDPEQAEGYLQDGTADVILLARELLRRPTWPFHAASKLGVAVHPPVQYERAWPELMTPQQ